MRLFLITLALNMMVSTANAITDYPDERDYNPSNTAITMQKQPDLWNGKKCAVVLTYDDALNVHLDHAIPQLDSAEIKGTFYISASFEGFRNRVEEWRMAASHGHELGNHTLFHPCDGSKPGREWVNSDYDLSNYTIRRIMDEIRINQFILEETDGKKVRSFAYTCGDMNAGDDSFKQLLPEMFNSARGVRSAMNTPGGIDLFNVDSYMISGQLGDELIRLVDEAMQGGKLLVFLFHGVGGEHSLDVPLEAHRQLVNYLKVHKEEIMIDTMYGIAEHIRNSGQIKP